MRIAVFMVLLLPLHLILAGLSQESGSQKVSVQDGEAIQGVKENSGQAQKGEKKALTNVDVISMVRAGLGGSTIVLAIQGSPTDFDTSPAALISLKNQGVSQNILNAMLTAGVKKTIPPAMASERAPIGRNVSEGEGKWEVGEEVSPIDGSRTVTLTLIAEQSVPGIVETGGFPMLLIRCKSHGADTYIHTGSLPFEADRDGKYSVRLRLDDGQPFTQYWVESTGQDSLFAPDPVRFAQMLAGSKKLAFEFTPLASGPVATWFDLSGLAGVLGKVADACGWPSQEAVTEGSTPDLHTIRKVLLKIDWSNYEGARKVVEKHTCLQVVETLRAAEATLSWQAGAGATLTLVSKDDQVIWRKKSFTPAFGALKEAVGCPK